MPRFDYPPIRLSTARSGPFEFTVGVDGVTLESLLLRIGDAYRRFLHSPLVQVANQLEKEVVVSSVFSTNSIEGGTLTEAETQLALDLPVDGQGTEQQRAINLKAAYDFSLEAIGDEGWVLDLDFIRQLHALITQALPHEYNRPGVLRDNPKAVVTRVGDEDHGGSYRPPQYGGDIRALLAALIDWQNELEDNGVPALIRAPLLHYYFERIHPFWDGNGRVGRVLEATILHRAGFRFAPFALAGYYYERIDRYFSMFNECRRRERQAHRYPNQPFVEFFLEGFLDCLHRLHDRVDELVGALLFENRLKRHHDRREINDRQYAIVSQLLAANGPVTMAALRQAPWYRALYTRLTDKTRRRDIKRLLELGLIHEDDERRMWPGPGKSIRP